jgi:urea transport system substrate-binding protein
MQEEERQSSDLRPVEGGVVSRRVFLKYVGLAGAAVAVGGGLGNLLTACGKADTSTTTGGPTTTAAGPATTAASAATTVSTAGGAPIKVGVVAPLSGGIAFLGVPMVAAGKLWAKQVNASGGILGRQVELLIEDEASDPKTTVEKTKLVISNGAEVLTGPLLGTEWGAMMPVGREANLIMLYNVYAWGGKDFTDPLMFTTGTIPSQTVTPYVPWLVEQYGKKFYFIASDYQYGHIITETAKAALLAAGGEVLGEEYVAFGTTDYSSSITRVVAAAPEVVYGSVVGEDAIALCKQYYDTGLIEKHRLVEPVDATALVASGPAVVEGMPTCQAYFDSIDTPTNKAFVEAYKEFEPDTLPTDITASFYISLQMWAKAVELAGTTETAAVKAKLEGLTVEDTPAGPVTLRATDHYPVRSAYIAVFRSGKLEVVKNLGIMDPGPDQRTVVYS